MSSFAPSTKRSRDAMEWKDSDEYFPGTISVYNSNMHL